MTYRCCLCAPDKTREGRIRDGYGVPVCPEHFAQGYWRSRQPRPSSDARPMSVVEQAFAHAMLAAAAPIAASG
jgi:hypothetical protein